MIKDWDLIKSKKRTRIRIRKGVPDKVRGLVWNLLGDVPNLISSNPGKYASLCESTHVPSQDIRDTILRDINRTFPRHAMFADEGTGQDCLRRVLIAYSLYDEEVGYCQGLGFITAMFLTYMPEEVRDDGRCLLFLFLLFSNRRNAKVLRVYGPFFF